MEKPCTLYIARHGEAIMNRDRIVMGQLDSPLNATGQSQAKQLGKLLEDCTFDMILTSDLQRAIDTAHIVTGVLIADIKADKRLRERTFGMLEGHPSHELEVARELQLGLTSNERWQQPVAIGAESDKDVFERVNACLSEVSAANAGKQILVVSHSGPIRALLTGLRLLDEKKAGPGAIAHGQYAVVTISGQEANLLGIYPSNQDVHSSSSE